MSRGTKQGTHWQDCYKVHLECALAKIKELEEERDRYKRLYQDASIQLIQERDKV